MLIFLALAFRQQLYLLLQRYEPGESCADPRRVRRQRRTFWVVVIGLVARSPGSRRFF
jgi:mercuric ion transport protein